MFLLIPYTRLTIKTQLSVQNAEKRLAAKVGKRPFIDLDWSPSEHKRPFTGSVKNGRFNIIRRLRFYQNSFRPVITGQFHDDLDKTRIEISMRLHFVVIVFIGIALMILTSSLFNNLPAYLKLPNTSLLQIIMQKGSWGLLFYAVTIGFFNYEVHWAQEILEKLFPS